MIGEGVVGVEIGDAVAVYGPWGCGNCYTCAQGKENYCPHAAELGITPPGLGSPGAMAEYMIVDNPRHLVPLGDLDPVTNVSLTDAGVTPYHAIKLALPKLVPGSVAVVIGTGGLGHVGIQILRAMTSATVVALDVNEDKLQLAKDVGAHHAFLSDEAAVDEVKKLTQGLGAHAVFDFVGIQPTMTLGQAMVRVQGDQVLVGMGSGSLPVGMLDRPYEASLRSPYWGSRSELFEILDLARSGAVHVETEVFTLDDAPSAYEKLHAGNLRGRAVIVP